jgi:hypothetical protein
MFQDLRWWLCPVDWQRAQESGEQPATAVCNYRTIFNHSPLALFSFCSNLGFPIEPNRCLLRIAHNALKSLRNYVAS